MTGNLFRRACLPVLCLLVLAGCAAAPEFVTPKGAINQVYAVIDRQTLAAIRQSAYLAESFADLREVSGDNAARHSSSGVYLTGRETTVGLFAQRTTPGRSGLGIGLDTIGETAAVRRNYRTSTGLEPVAFARSQLIGELDVPWFLSTLPGGIDLETPPDFAVWTMEYQPAYFVANKDRASGGDPADITRRRYNAHRFDASRLMLDVVAVTFDARRAEGEAAIPLMEAAGLSVGHSASQALARGRADSVTINLLSDETPAGLREIEFLLNRDVAGQHVERLGNSELVVGPGRRALWRFR